MIYSRITNSFVFSLSLHVLIFVFLIKILPQQGAIGTAQPFRAPEVSVLQGSDAKRIEKWLSTIKETRREEGITETTTVNLDNKIKARLELVFGGKIEDKNTSAAVPVETSIDSLKLSEKIDKLVSTDFEKNIDTGFGDVKGAAQNTKAGGTGSGAGTGAGNFSKIGSSGSMGDGSGTGGGSAEPGVFDKIKANLDMAEVTPNMEFKDEPIYIAQASGRGGGSNIGIGTGAGGGTGAGSGTGTGTGTGNGGVKGNVSSAQEQEKGNVVANDDDSETKIIGVLKKRNIIKYVKPEIPQNENIKFKKLQVVVRVTVLGSGEVENNVVIVKTSGYDSIDKAVVDAVLKWKFSQLSIDSTWQQQIGDIEFNFNFI